MRISILLASLISVPGLAQADDPARSLSLTPGEEGAELARPEVAHDQEREPAELALAHARFARALEARAGEILDRLAGLAADRAAALVEAREAERLGQAALASVAEPRCIVAPASLARGSMAIQRTGFSRAAAASAREWSH